VEELVGPGEGAHRGGVDELGVGEIDDDRSVEVGDDVNEHIHDHGQGEEIGFSPERDDRRHPLLGHRRHQRGDGSAGLRGLGERHLAASLACCA
jgi:hypothetical protein